MMQHVCCRCQGLLAAAAEKLAEEPPLSLVTEASDQHISSTCSRRLRDPNEWLAAVEDGVDAHPHSSDTTLRVARDIAARMPHSKDGHVAYALRDMMKRLGLARSTVTAHVRILRELGLLAWVSHGSSHNILRDRLGDRFGPGAGYRGTATIYAPCAPPTWDHARGRLRDGHGYHSRIRAYTPHGRAQAVAAARVRAAARARDSHSGAKARRTPSFTSLPTPPPAPEVEEINTPRARPAKPGAARRPARHRRGSTGYTPQQTKAAITYAQRVRLEVWWTQAICERRLGHALRPLIKAGYTPQEAACELTGWGLRLRPYDAAAYIRAELHRRTVAGLLALPHSTMDPRKQAPGDEQGRRYAVMLARREQHRPAYLRYREQLADPLRAALGKIATSGPPEPLPPWKPMPREPEEEFFASLAHQRSPLEAYRARISNTTPPRPDETLSTQKEDWTAAADQAQAAAAFERLRHELALPRPSRLNMATGSA
ncbi:hypothetical protein [Streptomyces sp. C10]|uniref:hypothetical protein n=1 Tax=Streptomyces sp. C10 TaxID=531941 RepID=UPI00398107CA